MLGPGVTKVKRLSEYFSGIRGPKNDCNIYFLEGKKPGGKDVCVGRNAPWRILGQLSTWILAKNAVMEQGTLIVALSANRSASTVTRPSGAYPPDFTIPTEWGGQKFRMGDRYANPLDQWPDPEVYIHYPSKQQLAYLDIRNLKRSGPAGPTEPSPKRPALHSWR